MVFTTFLYHILSIFFVSNFNNKQNKNSFSIIIIITISLFLSSTVNQSTLTAHGARPDVGFQDGISDCQSGTSNALNCHNNEGNHSAVYMEENKHRMTRCGPYDSNDNANQGVTNDNSAIT